MSEDATSPVIEARTRLTPDEISRALDVIAQVNAADGLAPLSEHVMLHLRHGGDSDDAHFLAYADGSLVGYAHLDSTDQVRGPITELAVAPDRRRQGVAMALLKAVRAASPTGHVRLWAHGEQTGARALAAALGYRGIRVLWQMRRSLRLALPLASMPKGYTVRAFQPGADDDAWLALNAEVFRDHPEQGAWTQRDLDRRMAEPWFRPEGFLIAEHGGRIVGFHWTKVHGLHEGDHDHEAIGEVYVIGVAPQARGTGLGRALLVAGLTSLRDLGLDQVMLYVDGDNTDAIALYEANGFVRWDTDTEFTSEPSA